MIGILEREKIGEGELWEGVNFSLFDHFQLKKNCHYVTHPGWATNYEDSDWIILNIISLPST